MIKFFKNLFTHNSATPAERQNQFEYKEFTITPMPQKAAGGWQVNALIEKPINDEIKQYQFIRADKTSSRDECVELIERKTKLFIDQIGDKIFNS